MTKIMEAKVKDLAKIPSPLDVLKQYMERVQRNTPRPMPLLTEDDNSWLYA